MDLDAFESRLNEVEVAIYGTAPHERFSSKLSNIIALYQTNSVVTNDIHSLLNSFSTVITNKRTSIEQLTQRISELIHDKKHIEQLVRSIETILAHEHVVSCINTRFIISFICYYSLRYMQIMIFQ